MHAVIMNGSPRIRKHSNTDRILARFLQGMTEDGSTFEQYEISDRKQWERARTAFQHNDRILIALPLYVENIPGLLMEFLETLIPRGGDATLSFILQGGFAEGAQLRCGEAYLEMLAGRLGCRYGGTLVKGDNFGIRLTEGKEQERITAPYREMGRVYSREGSFFSEECRKFTGPETFPFFTRLLISVVFRMIARKRFARAARAWGATRPLDDRPYGGRGV